MTEAAAIEGQAVLRGEVRDGFTAVNTRLAALGGEASSLGQKPDSFHHRAAQHERDARPGLVGKNVTND
ncbi:hypothetical protein [Streptomyces sp. NPDC058394]|uniref:hypothetical protein n=1 Tax=Streptomyces sp. NPDC058394 TaxID=3346477 RepID=UPI00364DF75F